MAEIEDCSISSLVQRCVEEFLPVIRFTPVENNYYRFDLLLARITSAITTSDMRQCGVRPTNINFDDEGISVKFRQHLDEDGKPIPIEIADIFGPPQEENEPDEEFKKRREEYFNSRMPYLMRGSKALGETKSTTSKKAKRKKADQD